MATKGCFYFMHFFLQCQEFLLFIMAANGVFMQKKIAEMKLFVKNSILNKYHKILKLMDYVKKLKNYLKYAVQQQHYAMVIIRKSLFQMDNLDFYEHLKMKK